MAVFINLPNFFGPVSDPLQGFLNNFETQWGIFNEFGEPIAGFGLSFLIGATQSTDSFFYDKQMRVSDFPVEQGGFASYNKVEMSADPTITLNLTGSISDGTQFLNAIDAATKSINLYTIITPEVQYVDYAISSYNYSRTSSAGTTLLSVQLFLTEIRQIQTMISNTQSANSTITSPINPSAASSQSGGIVQSAPVSTQTQNNITNTVGV